MHDKIRWLRSRYLVNLCRSYFIKITTGDVGHCIPCFTVEVLMKKEIQLFQKEMEQKNIQMCLVPTGDYHLSEYIDDYFKIRAFLSGFTGSAGTLLITKEKAMLWTDGRYFIQAARQLQNTGIELMKSGEEGVPTVEEYVAQNLKEGDTFCFDGKVVSAEEGKKLASVVESCGGKLVTEQWIDTIWSSRPDQTFRPVERLDLVFTGRSVQDKLEMVRKSMSQSGADCHVLSSLDDIAWLYNLRGKDIPHNPVFYGFSVITETDAWLFADEHAVDEALLAVLQEEHITVLGYETFYGFVEQNIKNKKILLDYAHSSYAVLEILQNPGNGNKIIEKENPTALFKAIKTNVEADNIRKAHELDALAMIRFIFWVKNSVKDVSAKEENETKTDAGLDKSDRNDRAGKTITEKDAADYLDTLRLSQPECVDISFETIAAYGENAAICHYSPDENSLELKPEGFLLVDSGGQYEKGTTDITRTIALGKLTEKQKEHYTLVLKGHIRLAMARFPKGICGANLDVLARGPLWERGLDYNHGTGHGVGYYLNVHEGPQNISWKMAQRKANTVVLEPGMLTSNEPGLYLEGQYGIRLENLILTKTADDPQMKNFLEFETVTLVPFEREAILPELLEAKEKEWLNAYHQKIYGLYKNQVTEEERQWLWKTTQPL